jgi:2-polyprenyl-3-methyl-5-hydroxy-6-metoxy-1,4-benzoquinol methylase
MTTPESLCPACRKSEKILALSGRGFTIWRCAGCGLGATVPPPAEADGLERHAADAQYVTEAWADPKDRWWRRFTEAPLDLLAVAGARPGMRLLDVGCNLGYFVLAARARGYAATGFDGAPAAVEFARSELGLDVTCARLETASFSSASYEIVALNHVLEHLPDPRAALTRVSEWVAPGGFLLVTLPNFASPIARTSGARWAGLVPDQHVWHFTPRALTRLVARAGFMGIRWRTRMMMYAPRRAAEWLKWGMRRALEPLGRADNLLLVARKPRG